MIDALALLGVLLLPFLLGSALLRRLGVRFGDDGLAWLGWCWPLGALTTALLTGLWMATGAEPRAGLMYLPPVGLWLALWFWPRPDATIGSAMRTSLVRRLAVALVALVAVLPLTRHALEEYGRPIHGDDDASIWTFKAVILAEHGRFDAALAEKLDERKTGAHHLDYPLLNPLLQVFILGATDERVAGALRWPSIFWALSLLALAGSAFLRAGGLLAGSLLWLAFAWAPAFQARVLGTKSDVITALGLLALIDAIGRLRATRSMALVAAMAAILVWSKNEGLMLACVVLIALGLRQGRSLLAGVWRPASLWLLLPLGVALGQWAFNRYYGLENDLLTGGAGRD
ncbi:MAG: hypothetical protein KDB53_00280, partial [Planctomycetes bacterium]|nr:hypothetical protein [Planctomycetota bacterium]